MAKSTKFYVVWRGNQPGIYDNWLQCKAQIDGFQGAQYKAFPNKAQAELAFKDSYWKYVYNNTNPESPKPAINNLPIEKNSICVDAACSSNPGVMEYRCVDTATKEVIFHRGPFEEGTNNIGEFLGLVHAIAYLQKNNIVKTVYTDSATAIAWVKAKKAKTKLEPTDYNTELFELIERAENYLKTHTISIDIRKWDTEHWGEIPADFGRK